MNRPAHQRRQAHRRRKALGRALHQLHAIRVLWMRAWDRYRRGRGPKPARIRLPRMLRKHKPLFRRVVIGAVT